MLEGLSYCRDKPCRSLYHRREREKTVAEIIRLVMTLVADQGKPRPYAPELPAIQFPAAIVPASLFGDTTDGDGITAAARRQAFADWWQHYPVKRSRIDALRVWMQKEIKPVHVPKMIEILEKQKQSTQWKRGYIPHPTKYIRNEGWTEDPDTQPSEPALSRETEITQNALRSLLDDDE